MDTTTIEANKASAVILQAIYTTRVHQLLEELKTYEASLRTIGKQIKEYDKLLTPPKVITTPDTQRAYAKTYRENRKAAREFAMPLNNSDHKIK